MHDSKNIDNIKIKKIGRIIDNNFIFQFRD